MAFQHGAGSSLAFKHPKGLERNGILALINECFPQRGVVWYGLAHVVEWSGLD